MLIETMVVTLKLDGRRAVIAATDFNKDEHIEGWHPEKKADAKDPGKDGGKAEKEKGEKKPDPEKKADAKDPGK